MKIRFINNIVTSYILVGGYNSIIQTVLAAPKTNTKTNLRHLEPLPDLKYVGDGAAVTNWMLGRCEGDCDHDGHCQYGLICFQRSIGSPTVPGCNGDAVSL